MRAGALPCLVVIPDHAFILSREGWTIRKLKDFIMKNAPSGIGGATLQDEDFIVVVAGGPGVWMGLHRSAGGFGNSFATQKIELLRNWDKLVAKYKNIVPSYESY
jgi:hypothetical protein